ncbi:DUF883 domain-containing protein [Sulfitobacter sp. F26169L]|uniref:DUF883 family protein n=1 Tax=Sulfitobacter sp. F26169L TaxID=2996015 RepID=UPI002260AE10|nr:DUF883 domain-containing protein [Sulfitobacter sp. F26169L]MCX7566577.1 DUF883 domain-containing protein [Sulfitobacter sp. F26169L]
MAKASQEVTVEDLSAQMDVLKRDLSSLTQTLTEYGFAKTAAAKQSAKETAADLSAAGREKAALAQMQAEDFVRTQPATALGLAAGLGFLVGLITTSRR